MGGEIASITITDDAPISSSDWRDLLASIATADSNTFVRVVVHSEIADAPPAKEYNFPASYFSFIPKFVATIPVEPPPAPTTATYWAVTNTNVRATPNGTLIGVLQPGASGFVVVDLETLTTIVPNRWAQIIGGIFDKKWVAVNVMSATRP